MQEFFCIKNVSSFSFKHFVEIFPLFEVCLLIRSLSFSSIPNHQIFLSSGEDFPTLRLVNISFISSVLLQFYNLDFIFIQNFYGLKQEFNFKNCIAKQFTINILLVTYFQLVKPHSPYIKLLYSHSLPNISINDRPHIRQWDIIQPSCLLGYTVQVCISTPYNVLRTKPPNDTLSGT